MILSVSFRAGSGSSLTKKGKCLTYVCKVFEIHAF